MPKIQRDRELEQRVQYAFCSIHVPEQVKEETLSFILSHTGESAETGLSHGEMGISDTASKDPLTLLGRPSPRRRSAPWRAFAAAAACLALALGLFGGWQVYSTPTAFIDVDMNPSLQWEVNRFDRVVAVRGLNEDGARAAEQLNLVHKPADQAMADVLSWTDSFAQESQVDQALAVSVSSEDGRQAQELQGVCIGALESSQYPATCVQVDEETMRQAQAAGMGAGRYLAAQELMDLDPSLTLEDCAGMTMSELRNRILQAGGTLDLLGVSCGSGYGAGHGQGTGSNQGVGHHGQESDHQGTGNQGNGAGYHGKGAGSGNGNGAGFGASS